MKNQHILYICTTCGEQSKNTSLDTLNQRDGEKLLRHLKTLHQDWELREQFAIQPIQCMGVCERDCAIAFIATGKRTYLFGNLPTDDARLEETTSAIFKCAQQYYAQSDGTLSYFARPELLKTRVLARIPPSPQ